MKTLITTVLAVLAAGGLAAAPGEAARDPMVPPPAARPAAMTVANTAPEAAPAAAPVLRQILVVDGRRYAVEGTRLRSVGDRYGTARIERIGDDAIWLREGGTLQRLPLFGAVERRAAIESAPAIDAASAPLTARGVARAPRLRPSSDTP
jgi:pyruvate/2-oxoglutarate dehydrogenase complex dihydrolipoamide acyltransferase (E2) component